MTLILSFATVVVRRRQPSRSSRRGATSTFLKPDYEPVGLQYLGALLLDFVLLVAWSALYYGINYYLLLEEEIDQRAHLESAASSAQLAMLRYQLNPHFLFNTLNSISTLVLLKQTERANAMLARLSSFLRYTLANEPTAQVTLAQEVETLKLYLEIEKMRFEDRLRPHFQIDSSTRSARACPRCCSSRWSRMRSNMPSPRARPGPTSGSRPSGRGRGCGSRSPTAAPAHGVRPEQPFFHRRRSGEHQGPSGASLWRGARIYDQVERSWGVQRYHRHSARRSHHEFMRKKVRK